MSRLKIGTAPPAKGFSLIELMIALVAGLIVVGAVLAFTVSSVRANSDYVKSARLTQELRNTSDYIASELKRAGYDETAMSFVANPLSTAASKFSPILVDTTAGANCVIYAYDRGPAGTQGAIDLNQGEIRAIRRKTWNGVGVVEVGESTSTVTPICAGASPDYTQYPVTCNTASGWCALSDPRVLDITTFTVGKTASGTVSNGVQTVAAASGFNAMEMREFLVTVAGSLRNDPGVTRTVRSNIKVRADCLRALLLGACDLAPAP